MILPLDIHTHHVPSVPGVAIVNCFPETFNPQPEGWYSVGIHPWYVTASCGTGWLESLRRQAFHPQVLALGEAGLDKLCATPWALQVECFVEQAKLAEEVKKPLVIHAVKSVDELLAWKRKIRPVQPWIIHGFRGKKELAHMLLQHGFYLSLGAGCKEETLGWMPVDGMLLETDESGIAIEELLQLAARLRRMEMGQLSEILFANVRRLFF